VKVSVIIPCFNERATILEVVRRVKTVDLDLEIIIVDDGSTDGTRDLIQGLHGDRCRVILHDNNRGKGAAIRSALPFVTGDVIVVQDADLEYDPRDLPALMQPIATGRTSVVYGSRNLRLNVRSYSSFYWGGRLVSLFTTLLFGQRITDEPTGYKMLRTDLLRSLDLKSERFGFCPEVTAKLLRRGHEILEVPISYSPRGFAEGKKIRWTDGLEAMWLLFKYRFTR
jgi:glycosyltransferase involved in cell wall biosynthesis